MEQSDQTQGKLLQDEERQAVLTFLEYIKTLQQVDTRYRYYASFDTGEYYDIGTGNNVTALHILTLILNESLHKKTPAHIGKKLTRLSYLEDLIWHIAPFLGITNLAMAGHRTSFSLAHLLFERPGGLLEPLNEKEWQTLTNQAIVEMLKRRQKVKNQDGTWYTVEEETDFSYGEPNYVYNNNFAFFQTTKKYSLANGEANRAARTIVDIEKFRLNLFLEALLRTFRFLDRLTRLPNYTEVQVAIPDDYYHNVAKFAANMIATLTSLLGDDVSEQKEPVRKNKQVSGIVESELVLPTKVTLQVRKEEHKGDLHTYHLILTDSKHLSEPVLFLLQVSESGEAELFEDDSNG